VCRVCSKGVNHFYALENVKIIIISIYYIMCVEECSRVGIDPVFMGKFGGGVIICYTLDTLAPSCPSAANHLSHVKPCFFSGLPT